MSQPASAPLSALVSEPIFEPKSEPKSELESEPKSEPLSAAPVHDGLPSPRRHLAVAVLLIALVLVVLDGAIANVALPSIVTSLGADASATVWVVSSYQLAVLVALLPCGALGEIYGARRGFVMGVALFTLASAACAFAPNLPALVIARFVQGLGGGAIMALGIANLRFAVPHRLLGAIIGINAMTIAISAAAGPAIAGAILSVAGWQWLVAVNIPLGVLALLAGGFLGHMKGIKRRLNAVALVANTLMFVLFFTGADRIATAPISGALLMAGAIVSLVVLLIVERGTATPIVPTDLLAEPAFRVAVIASVSCFTGQMLSYVALPFYLQHALQMTPAMTGLFMMPWPAATIIAAPISGRLANRIKTAWLCATGGALLAFGLLVIALSPFESREIAFVVGAVFAGAGFGLFQTPNNRILIISAPKARSGAAGAMQGTARLLGQTFGAIAMSIIFAPTSLAYAPTLALVLAAACTAFAALVSLSRAQYETVSQG